MHRTRNNAYGNVKHHLSVADLLAHTADLAGVHTVSHSGQLLDIMVADRGSGTTLVSFHGSLPRTRLHYPQFPGLPLTERLGANLISVADPAIAMGNLDLGWHLGNMQIGPLRPVLTPIIRHLAASLNSSRLIFFGGSGGGYAAGYYAHNFPGSVAFIFNPRLSLARNPKAKVKQYLEVCHGRLSTTHPSDDDWEYLAQYGPIDLASLTTHTIAHHLLIYQNLQDSAFLRGQLLPFMETVGDNPRVQVRFGDDGPGHVFIPKPVVRSILHPLVHTPDLFAAITEAGFSAPLQALSAAVKALTDEDD